MSDISAATIVVEENYVDGDYLADFASYYVSCFESYDRFCRRLHFFESAFDATYLTRMMLGHCTELEVEAFFKAYLGFVVVRPLPDAVVGRTALRPYPPDGGRRNYTALVPYKVSLYGIRLEIESLAYQEQDTVLAACATVSLWSALHRTAYVYGTRAPRPPVITADATRTVLYQRALPSTGLRLEQMMAAVRAADLDPEAYEPVSASGIRPLSSLIYAYNRGGLPVILVVNIQDLGQHAITIAGFSLLSSRAHTKEVPDAFYKLDGNNNFVLDSAGQPLVTPINDFPPMRGLRINEFYAHDDGAGPFSRLVVKQPTPGPHRMSDTSWRTRFEGQWLHPNGTPREMHPTCVIVPVYQKIRLHFDVVMAWLQRLHPVLYAAAAAPLAQVEWDVFITETKDYKRDVQEMSLHDERKRGLLQSSQPRFIWRLVFRVDDMEVAEFLLDATSFAKAFPIFVANWFDPTFTSRVESLIKTGHLTAMLTPSLENLVLREIEHREAAIIG